MAAPATRVVLSWQPSKKEETQLVEIFDVCKLLFDILLKVGDTTQNAVTGVFAAKAGTNVDQPLLEALFNLNNFLKNTLMLRLTRGYGKQLSGGSPETELREYLQKRELNDLFFTGKNYLQYIYNFLTANDQFGDPKTRYDITQFKPTLRAPVMGGVPPAIVAQSKQRALTEKRDIFLNILDEISRHRLVQKNPDDLIPGMTRQNFIDAFQDVIGIGDLQLGATDIEKRDLVQKVFDLKMFLKNYQKLYESSHIIMGQLPSIMESTYAVINQHSALDGAVTGNQLEHLTPANSDLNNNANITTVGDRVIYPKIENKQLYQPLYKGLGPQQNNQSLQQTIFEENGDDVEMQQPIMNLLNNLVGDIE